VEPLPLDIPVDGGTLRALKFRAGQRIAVAAHGITGSAMSYPAVARRLPEGWSLVALDLRGRGGSAHLPGPYGIDRHAGDMCRVSEYLGAGAVTAVGHSMGAYVALRAVAREPGLWDRLVLVDGGIPLPVPDGADLDAVLAATVGSALDRLRLEFPSERAYLDFFRALPALGRYWTEDLDAYVRYDLTGADGALRSRTVADAVRVDGREVLTLPYAADLAALTVPTLLLHAARGMFDQTPGLLPESLVAPWRSAGLRTELVPDVNHYTILFGDHGAATVAARIADPDTWS
jgi:pimeloyl-ACP methyl ester carboxylesterase